MLRYMRLPGLILIGKPERVRNSGVTAFIPLMEGKSSFPGEFYNVEE